MQGSGRNDPDFVEGTKKYLPAIFKNPESGQTGGIGIAKVRVKGFSLTL